MRYKLEMVKKVEYIATLLYDTVIFVVKQTIQRSISQFNSVSKTWSKRFESMFTRCLIYTVLTVHRLLQV